MKIKTMRLRNFRSYQEEVVVRFDDLTVIVGKNDIGKSTILEALDIFFNDGDGVVKLDRSDVNVFSSRNSDIETSISVSFSGFPDRVVLDSSVETSLHAEHMLNIDGQLEIIKKYRNGGAKPSVFLKAVHPTADPCKDLLQKKNAELKQIIVDNQIQCDNLSVNSQMRQAIWNHFSHDLNCQETEIDVSKEDAKRIWEKLGIYLPAYTLFQADRKNSDGDDEVQDPLKAAVKEIINDECIQAKLSEVAQVVEDKLREVSQRTLVKIREMDPSIADSLCPVIPSAEKLRWGDVFKAVSISGDDDIPINKRGSGIKRMVLLNFFRAEAERRASEGKNTGVIYALEEPETSQHFNNQRIIVKALKELSKADNTQVVLTTHSAVIVKELDFSSLRLVFKDSCSKRVIEIEPAVLQYPSLNEVNYIAYGEVTEEYHNELYGYLEFQQWLSDYKKGRKQRKYNQERNGSIYVKQYVLTEYIRHQIHHPENHHNPLYSRDELKQSIEDMRDYIKGRKENEAYWGIGTNASIADEDTLK